MEHGGKGRERVGAGVLHFAHHIDGDGTCLAQRNLDLAALIARSQAAADTGVGLCHRQSAHGDGPEILHHDVAVGRDGGREALLRGPVHVDDHRVARPQPVVLWGGNVHFRFKGELLVVEDVAAEHLSLFLFLPVQHAAQQGQRVFGRHECKLVLHLYEVGIVLVVLLFPLACALYALRGGGLALLPLALGTGLVGLLVLAVVGAQTVVGGLALVGAAQSAVLAHLLVFAAHAANLRDVHAPLHQLGHDLGLRSAPFHFLLHELGHLRVGHRRLGLHGHGSQQEEGKCYD